MTEEKKELKILPVHPTTAHAFKEWFKEFSSAINLINLGDPFSPNFQKVVEAFTVLSVEISYEIGSKSDRSTGSVYDRSDYVVREILRTNRVMNIMSYLRIICNAFATGDADIQLDGIIIYKGTPIEAQQSTIILREIPSTFALIFTAIETIGTINIDDLLHIVKDILTYALKNQNSRVSLNDTQYDIFTGIISATKSCIDNLKALNSSLFFTLFQDFGILELLVQCVKNAYLSERIYLSGWCTQCICVYIEASQSEPDLKKNAENPEFVEKYKEMMDTVVNPLIKQDREHRAKFRAILHYSRSLK